MKCIGGALLTAGEARLWHGKRSWTQFGTLNELRLQLLTEPGISELDWEDFGRGAEPVKKIMLCAALTALDVPGINWSNCTVIGWNGDGCRRENVRYFADYLDSGRSGGRGSLFVPTLPSIPFCEAAIMLKCHGGGTYFSTAASTRQLAGLLPLNGEKMCLIGEITANWSALVLCENSSDSEFDDAANLQEFFRRNSR